MAISFGDFAHRAQDLHQQHAIEYAGIHRPRRQDQNFKAWKLNCRDRGRQSIRRLESRGYLIKGKLHAPCPQFIDNRGPIAEWRPGDGELDHERISAELIAQTESIAAEEMGQIHVYRTREVRSYYEPITSWATEAVAFGLTSVLLELVKEDVLNATAWSTTWMRVNEPDLPYAVHSSTKGVTTVYVLPAGRAFAGVSAGGLEAAWKIYKRHIKQQTAFSIWGLALRPHLA